MESKEEKFSRRCRRLSYVKLGACYELSRNVVAWLVTWIFTQRQITEYVAGCTLLGSFNDQSQRDDYNRKRKANADDCCSPIW